VRSVFFMPVYDEIHVFPRVLEEIAETGLACDGCEELVRVVNAFVWLLTGTRLTDATCGYRALRLDLVRGAEFDWRAPWLYTYGSEYYLYAKAVLDPRVRCLEVPITMRYPPSGPYSKIRPGTGWWAMLRPWLQARVDGRGFGALPSPSRRADAGSDGAPA